MFPGNHAYFPDVMHIFTDVMFFFPEIMHVSWKSCIISQSVSRLLGSLGACADSVVDGPRLACGPARHWHRLRIDVPLPLARARQLPLLPRGVQLRGWIWVLRGGLGLRPVCGNLPRPCSAENLDLRRG